MSVKSTLSKKAPLSKKIALSKPLFKKTPIVVPKDFRPKPVGKGIRYTAKRSTKT